MEEKNNKGILTNLVRRLLLIVLGLIIGVNMYLANARGLTGNQMPMPFGTGCAVVLSGSMEPELSVDDLIIVREANTYEVNDVVVYQNGFELIVHRIINIDGDTITTKGDANNVEDTPTDISAIKGRVVASIPKIGLIAQVLKTPLAILLLGVLAFVLMEVSFRKEKEADSKNLDAIKEEIRMLKAQMDAEGKDEEE